MTISLSKIEAAAPALVSLTKTAGHAVAQAGLDGQTARVALVLDYSGSMGHEYASGAIQRLAEKVLALALNLDDDGAIDVFVFDSDAAHLGSVGLTDFAGSVQRLTRARSMGSTNYAAAFTRVKDFYFGGARRLFGRKAPSGPQAPVFAIFLTDGAPDSQQRAERALVEASAVPIFWKFLSIGPRSIPFLRRLDDLTDRTVDNADYQYVGDVDGIDDERLYALLLEEYPEWLTAVRSLSMIA